MKIPETIDKINQVGATAISLIALFRQLREQYKAMNPDTTPDAFLTDEMLIQEARRASIKTVATVDAIRERHGLKTPGF